MDTLERFLSLSLTPSVFLTHLAHLSSLWAEHVLQGLQSEAVRERECIATLLIRENGLY